MTRTDTLHDLLQDAYSDSRFHSLLGSLRGIDDEAARWTPADYHGFHHMDGSILSLVYHTGGDKHVLMSYAFGDASVTWEVVNARFRELGSGLGGAMRLAEEGHALVLSTLAALEEIELDIPRPYYGGKHMPAYEVFRIVAEHDLYHAGQINYVRCMLGSKG